MFKLYQGFYFICLIILTGCVSSNQTNLKKNEMKTETPKVSTKKVLKKINSECIGYKKIMNYSNSYIIQEFDDGYLIEKDLIGAKAQLFLIENRSQSIFAKNMNKARDTYLLNYKIALAKKCNLKKFEKDPINIVKKSIKKLETK